VKYLVILGDGMADEPIAELGNKTILQAAHTPHMDSLAARAKTLGLTKTIPDGFHPGSDVGNMSVLGYNPDLYYTGRAPIEAASMGIELAPADLAIRCNLVTLKLEDNKLIMEDYSAGHIDNSLAHRLIKLLQPEIEDESFSLYAGVSYRHLLVWHHGMTGIRYTAPHDILGQPIAPHLPKGDGAEHIMALMDHSREILHDEQANSIWLWGAGKRPKLQSFAEKFNVTGAVISAVDLVKGLGILAGLEVVEVEGATGYIDTNYQGKVEATLDALRRHDFVYLHIEAPDETGHEGVLEKKVQAVEDLDEKVVGPIINSLTDGEPFRLMLLPDHPTPLRLRTHTADPVPFLIYDSTDDRRSTALYNEQYAKSTGVLRADAYLLMDELIG